MRRRVDGGTIVEASGNRGPGLGAKIVCADNLGCVASLSKG